MGRPSVRYTDEFERVRDLPRRQLDERLADSWAELWSNELRAPGSRSALRRWQGLVIAEGVEHQGGFYVLPVGFGKTVPTSMMCVAAEYKRPILIIPAGLRDKTYGDFGSYVGQWRTPNPPPRLVTREELALEKNANLLELHKPDAILIDEGDEASNPLAGAVRRIDRYVVPRTQAECAVHVFTGTPMRKSLLDFWHLICWTHRDGGCPLPYVEGEAKLWAASVDELGNHAHAMRRVLPGPLGDSVAAARRWIRQRLQETPGVIIIDGDSAVYPDGSPIPLNIRMRLAKECPKIDAHYKRFMLDQENPDGIPCSTPLDRFRTDHKLGCGVFERYVAPGPPQEYRDARRVFSKFCREAIQESTGTRQPIDTELQVINRFHDEPEVEEWLPLKHLKYPTEAIWLSTATIESAVAWLRESNEPGIVWCGGVEFAHALSSATRLPYFGPEGKDQNGNELDAISRLRAWHSRSFVASWNANKKGFNLQAWRRHLIVHPPSSAKWLEQIFGRSHRSLQTGPVTFDILATSGATLDLLETAIAEARIGKLLIGPSQKILRANITRVRPIKTAANKYRWATADEDKAAPIVLPKFRVIK